jgi:hypothetical protein
MDFLESRKVPKVINDVPSWDSRESATLAMFQPREIDNKPETTTSNGKAKL